MARVMATLALFAGIGLLILACHLATEEVRFANESVLASGEIVGVRENGGTGISFHPVVRFSTRKGQVVTAAVHGEVMGPQYEVGRRVEVFYDPAESSQVKLGTRSANWGAALSGVAAGGLLFFAGLRTRLSKGPASTVEPETRRKDLLKKWPWLPVAAVWLFWLVVGVGVVVTTGREDRKIKTTRGTCAADDDCPSTFCDRGLCAPSMGETPHYGRPCTPSTAPRTGKERGDAATCGPFVCVAGRCQSCSKDSDCQPGAEWAQLCMGTSWGLSACADHPGDMNP